MKRLTRLAGCMVEAAVLATLLWRFTELYLERETGGALPFCYGTIAYALIMFVEWRSLRGTRLGQKARFRLCFLTGSCACLSMLLVVHQSIELSRVRMGASKHLIQAVKKEQVPSECVEQWLKDRVQSTKSERGLYAMLLASTCLLYASRYSEAREQFSRMGASSEEARRNASA